MAYFQTKKNSSEQEWVRRHLEVWMQKSCPDLVLNGLPTVLGEDMQPREFPDYKTWEKLSTTAYVSTAYGEIKCRQKPRYTKKYFEDDGRYMTSTDKLRLMAGFDRRGFRAEFAFRTVDMAIFFMQEITHALVESFRDAPKKWTQYTNNGKDIRSVYQPCKLIPMKHFVMVRDIEKHGTG